MDLMRAALSEIEQYDRVVLDVEPTVSVTSRAAVAAGAAVDIVHMLAELLENATAFAPSMTLVSMSGSTARDGGWLVSIADRGTGMPEELLRQLNEQLAHPPLADEAVDGHMGLFAVAHLAARHDISVAIMQPPGGGTNVEVHIPAALISRAAPAIGTAGAARHDVRLLAAPPPPLALPRRFAEPVPHPVASEQEGLPIFDSAAAAVSAQMRAEQAGQFPARFPAGAGGGADSARCEARPGSLRGSTWIRPAVSPSHRTLIGSSPISPSVFPRCCTLSCCHRTASRWPDQAACRRWMRTGSARWPPA